MSELIDRQAAIRATWQEPSYTDPLNVLTEVRDRLNALPTIDAVEVRHGEWIYHNYENGNWYCTCSNCGKGDLHAIKGTVPYCWNCGARMDGERREG